MKAAELFRLDGKVVLITGGSGLIGRAVLEALPQLGAQVAAGARDLEKLNRQIAQLPDGTGPRPCGIRLDISSKDSIQQFFAEAHQRFGKIDVLINNAWPKTDDWLSLFEDVRQESLYRNLCDNAGGYFLCCQEAARYMKQQKSGVILNVGSIYGAVGPHFDIYEGTDMTSPAVYSLIKGGIHNFTRYLATYLAPYNIRVNCMSPGGVQDDSHQHPEFHKRYVAQTPLKRMAVPQDMVGPMVFLVSEASSYVTGSVVMVDGGWTAW